MDELIDTLVEDPNILSDLIREYATAFSNNPRELKRFINLFFFLAFLSKAREARGLSIPSFRQLARWIELSLKWPDFVRWLRRARHRYNDLIIDQSLRIPSVIGARLEVLERIGKEFGNKYNEWLSNLLEILIHGRKLTLSPSREIEENGSIIERSVLLRKIKTLPKELDCIADPEFMQFFYIEGNHHPEDDRLSFAGGKGFW